MKKVLSVLIFLPLLMSFLTACKDSRPITDALHRAEALMNEHPDSAWAVLNTLSPDVMGRNSTRAHYALLYTQAQDKNYIDETNDSLISVAVDYYRHTDDVRHKFLSYYYKGRVLTNAKDYLNATTYYMEAEQLADEVGDDYLVGLLYAELGRIYRLYYDYPKSLEAYQKAAECYERAGKIRHRNYMWLNLSDVLRNMSNYKECERLLLQALASGKADADSALIRLSMGTMVMQYVERKEMRKADSLFREFKPFINDTFGSSSFVARLAQMYLFVGNIDKAEYYLNEGWKRAMNRTDTVSLYVVSAELHSLKGKGEMAYQELKKGVLLQNKDTRQALQHPILTAQRDHLSERLEFETYKLRMEKRLNVLYLLVSTLVLGVVILVFFKVLRRKKQAITELEVQKKQVEKEKDDVFLKFQQLNEEKKKADKTIEGLKNDISSKEKENNEKIFTLIQKVKQGKEESKRSIEALNDAIEEKERNRQVLESKLQVLEMNSKANTESMNQIRVELEQQVMRKTLQILELLGNDLNHQLEWMTLHERHLVDESIRQKLIKDRIAMLKQNYFAGEEAYRKLEETVNAYLDDVMLHFREEVCLASERDYRRVCYMFAGVSGQAIGEIMGESKDAVYQRRSRLLKRMLSFSCVHKELFTLLLSKQLKIKQI